ncbi:tRNA (N(6)-L-threonylcarbamoyladenosine(37)-C(2))-methylthiotransferase MtaB [soil metagenome]
MAGLDIITLGCRLNIAEGETMRILAQGQDDLIIVNSCAVTGEAVRQTRQAIRRAHRARPEARIVVTGCAAQTDPAMFAAMPEVAQVLGNREKTLAASFHQPERVQVSDIMAVRETAPQLASAFAEHARAFVEVQNGCDHRCTFCIIPFGRGNSRSVPAGAIKDTLKTIIDSGYREIVLTGVDVTSYGHDLPGNQTLGTLIQRLFQQLPALPRLRLSSLDSIEIDDPLFALITGEPRLMPHLHLSLQSGDDLILKRMKRRHSRGEAIAMVERIKTLRPDVSIGADIIAGFPTETDAMFENSLRLIEECDIVHGHIFPYSPRAGTPAARMPQVHPTIVKERAARLRAACAERRRHWLSSLIGTRQSVLVERDGLTGHAENFAPVRFPSPRPPGEIATATIAALENGVLIAQDARHESNCP